MKKTIMFVAAVVVAVAFVGCGNKNTKGSSTASSQVDSLSYALGNEQSKQVKQRLAMMGIDTAYIDEFIKGFRDGADAVDNKKKQAYNAGVAHGVDMLLNVNNMSRRLFVKDSTKTLPIKQIIAGYVDGLKGKPNIIEMEDFNNIAMSVYASQFEENKAASEKFMKEVSKRKDVKALRNGIYYKVIKEGNGAVANDSSFVKLHYEGRTSAGKVFDSSYEQKEPVVMGVKNVIPGFAEALKSMPVGSVWEIYLPQDQAYGKMGAGENVEPYQALVFKVEVLGIEKNAPQPKMPANIQMR